jgi:hypothetical protein
MMTQTEQAQPSDPVLVQLQEWVRVKGLSRAAVSRELGVSRAAVAGWFLELEARATGRPPSSSARRFNYASQPPAVQRRIADLLGQPVDALRTLSRSSRLSAADDGGGPAQVVESEVWHVAGDVLDALALRSLAGALGADTEPVGFSLRHRVAETVESVAGVVATLIVGRWRGLEPRRVLYGHHVIVFVEPTGPGQDPGEHAERLRHAVEDALAQAGLPCRWEHGQLGAEASVASGDRSLQRLGALVVQHFAASRPPRTGLLLRPLTQRSVRDLRLAAVITSPYGGSGPIAGALAESLGIGHVRTDDLIRRVREVQARGRGRRGWERGAFLTEAALSDGGFVVQQGVRLLETGTAPGAWCLSMETGLLASYEPLHASLVAVRGVVVMTIMSPAWRRLAAWRLAAAERDEAGQPVVDAVTDGAEPTPDELAALAGHAATAAEWMDRLAGWEAILADVRARRDADPDRLTVTAHLDAFPAAYAWYAIRDGRWWAQTGPPVDGEHAVFPDEVDPLVDAWFDAAAGCLAQLARAVGYSSAEQRAALADALSFPPMRDRLVDGAAWAATGRRA